MSTVLDGFDRLAGLRDELKRLEEKKKIAEDNGAHDELLGAIDAAIAALKHAIAHAAVAEAKREAEEAVEEAKRLAEGKPPKPRPQRGGPGDQNPPNEGGKKSDGDDVDRGGGDNGNGGSGSGRNGDGSGDRRGGGSSGGSGGGSGAQKDLPEQVIYVRSADTVWAWNRYQQAWMRHDFTSPIIEITQVKGGLLVVARHSAVLFDAGLGVWLTPLQTEKTLETGPVSGGAS